MPLAKLARVAGVLFVAVTVAACGGGSDSKPQLAGGAGAPEADRVQDEALEFHGTLVDPSVPRPQLTLQDTDGRSFTFNDRPGDEVTVVFFGYTHCPDVCPTTLADLASARRQLPEEIRDRVTVTFVTEDPERDTPAVLRTWLDGFDKDFVGLRGGNEDTSRALAQLYLPQSKRNATPSPAVVHPDDGQEHAGDYGVDHAGVVYAFGPGEATVVYTGGTTPRQYAADLTRLAAGR